MHTKALAQQLAKTVRDFEHYFGTIDHPKLEEWIEETLKEEPRIDRSHQSEI